MGSTNLSKQIFENGPHFSKISQTIFNPTANLKRNSKGPPTVSYFLLGDAEAHHSPKMFYSSCRILDLPHSFYHSSVTRHDINNPFEVLKRRQPWSTLIWVKITVKLEGQRSTSRVIFRQQWARLGGKKLCNSRRGRKLNVGQHPRDINRRATQAKKSSFCAEFNCLRS